MEPAHIPTDNLKYYDNDRPPSVEKPKPSCLQRAGSALAGGLELFYYRCPIGCYVIIVFSQGISPIDEFLNLFTIYKARNISNI